jgi:sulfatase maturation enzyme AslB (radical SAM superfamily)
MWGMKKYYLGNIDEANPLELRKIPTNQEPCVNCDINELCGGRCLYTNLTRRWSKEAYASVCKTVRGLVDSVKEQIPLINQLISLGKISLNDFDYMEYNGCEIIP